MNLYEQVNSEQKMFFLENLIQINIDELVLFISEGKIDEKTEEEISFPNGFSLKGNPINTNETCEKYKITFSNIITYSVVMEHYIERDEKEEFTGNSLREFSKSRFLDYISSSLNAEYSEDIYNVKYRHYQLNCLDHVVDIACPFEPLIEEITE